LGKYILFRTTDLVPFQRNYTQCVQINRRLFSAFSLDGVTSALNSDGRVKVTTRRQIPRVSILIIFVRSDTITICSGERIINLIQRYINFVLSVQYGKYRIYWWNVNVGSCYIINAYNNNGWMKKHNYKMGHKVHWSKCTKNYLCHFYMSLMWVVKCLLWNQLLIAVCRIYLSIVKFRVSNWFSVYINKLINLNFIK
jgi:hypothetical protein